MSAISTESLHRNVEHMISTESDQTRLLQVLIEIQHQHHYIPAEVIKQLEMTLGLSRTYIESVISFYSFLSLNFEGQYRILFSDNFTDRLGGNRKLYQQLKDQLKDADVFIDFTSCTGLCDQGPGLLVNGIAINHLTAQRIDQISKLILSGNPVDEWPETLFDITDNIRRQDQQLNLPTGGKSGLSAALELGADKVLSVIEDAGLRGRGGAGFNTAKKWTYCRQNPEYTRFVVCNADEGEPGTFKDRVLLNRYADSIIEGMTVCAWVIEAKKGFIYLRGEYRYLLEPLKDQLQQRRDENLLGSNILGHQDFNFDIEIHLGAGAYICGEESALIESLEGKRGIPRIRPPFPVQQGYRNKPTVVNNVETFWSVSNILRQGADWFKQSGTEQSCGTRLLSISGDCKKPGIYEYPCGVTLTEILQDCGAVSAQAVQMAGAAGHTVLARDFDRRMSFEDLATGGSFMVIGPQRKLIDLLDNFATFFRHESCGFCTPCRVGTTLIEQIIQRFKKSQGSRIDIQQLQEISNIMKKTSFCGLGCSAPTAFDDALLHNPALFDGLMSADADNPVFDMEKETDEYRNITSLTVENL